MKPDKANWVYCRHLKFTLSFHSRLGCVARAERLLCVTFGNYYFFSLAFSFQAETLHQVNYSLAEPSAMSEQLASEDVPPTKVTQSWNVFILKQMTRSFDYCSMLRGGVASLFIWHFCVWLCILITPYYHVLFVVCFKDWIIEGFGFYADACAEDSSLWLLLLLVLFFFFLIYVNQQGLIRFLMSVCYFTH